MIYFSADASGVPFRPALLKGRRSKSPDGTDKTHMATHGLCRLSQHKEDGEGRPSGTTVQRPTSLVLEVPRISELP